MRTNRLGQIRVPNSFRDSQAPRDCIPAPPPSAHSPMPVPPERPREPSDQELRMWAIEQAVKWRAATPNAAGSIDRRARDFYAWAKGGFK